MLRLIMTCLWALLLHASLALAGEISPGPGAKPMRAHAGKPGRAAAGAGGLTKIRTPLLSQVLMFTLPKDFRTAFQGADSNKFTEEFIRAGESVDKWSQMIMMTGYKDLTRSQFASPEQFVTGVANLFRRNCPSAYSGVSLGASKIDGFDAYAAIMSCGLVKPEDPYSEASLFIVIRGDKDFYTLQWTEHGMAVNAPIRFDQAMWQARMDSLAPIKLCSDKKGEFPFYAGCFKPR